MEQPEPGWGSYGYVTRVIDGDTVEVEVRRKFQIRLRDINCPEMKEEAGRLARSFVCKLLQKEVEVDDHGRYELSEGNGKEVFFFIYSYGTENFLDFNSFSRCVGDIWVDNQHLASIIVAEGKGKKVKGRRPKGHR